MQPNAATPTSSLCRRGLSALRPLCTVHPTWAGRHLGNPRAGCQPPLRLLSQIEVALIDAGPLSLSQPGIHIQHTLALGAIQGEVRFAMGCGNLHKRSSGRRAGRQAGHKSRSGRRSKQAGRQATREDQAGRRARRQASGQAWSGSQAGRQAAVMGWMELQLRCPPVCGQQQQQQWQGQPRRPRACLHELDVGAGGAGLVAPHVTLDTAGARLIAAGPIKVLC